MNWYYVEQGQQAGPVDDAQLDELRRSGRIQDDTLVWREGMANWAPYNAAKGVPASAPRHTVSSAAGAPAGGAAEAVCAECGGIFPINDMIRYGDACICAACKPTFMQKISEGLVTGVRRGRRNLPVDPELLIAEVLARGVRVSIGDCVSRGWNLVKSNLGIAIGATLLVMLCNQAAGFIPFLGIILSLVVQGPLMGGLYMFFLKLARGEPATLGDAFSGFSNAFGRLCGTFLLTILLAYLWLVPVGFYLALRGGDIDILSDAIFWIILLIGLIGLIYTAVAFVFGLFLSADLELGPWNALRVSWRIVTKRWLSIFGLTVVAGLLSALGLFACIVGIIFTMPLFYAIMACAYEDLFCVAPART